MNFKPGDWVIHPEAEYPWQITQNSLDHLDNTILQLWQPKEGEYVWFWKMHNKELLYMFGRFSHHNEFGYIIDEDENGAIISSKLRYWDNCEPFIGNLPSFIKE